PRIAIDRPLPYLGDAVEVDEETVVRHVRHLDPGIERLAIVRARRAVRSGRVAVVDVPRAVVASDAAGGVRAVVDAVVRVVTVAGARGIVIGELPSVRAGRVVVRVPERRVHVVDPRVAEGHRLTRAV